MDCPTTITVFAAGALLTAAALFGDHRRRRAPGTMAALLPWHALLFAGVAMMLFMAVHGLTLLSG